MKRIKDSGVSCELIDEILDIDTPEDIHEFMTLKSYHGKATRKYLEDLGKNSNIL